ncbi:hypothetical protein PROFUN_00220 [Planoprotostelium fungivorum]|uniref:Myosin motor domain-containing protein n=1 Tax=Planoprotostelium fungivorum TaxID=1890364 RepID=A0A2P6NXT0_9EUKA|nr:hypothetical protein PROFUN_00220 [Planoprotostelium fungivorum]
MQKYRKILEIELSAYAQLGLMSDSSHDTWIWNPRNSFKKCWKELISSASRMERQLNRAISYIKIDFVDNQVCLDLIKKKPLGIFSLLDEESNFPKATNQTLL